MDSRRFSWGKALALAAPVTAAAVAWRYLVRSFRPPNSELAALHGLDLVRGPKRVLAITAHPDDLEIVAGGTLRLMSLAGSTIDVAVLTDGGRQDNARHDLGHVRQFEQDHAAAILGYARVHHLGLKDLSLSRIPELEDKIAAVWSRVKPQVALAFDPSFPEPYMVHPDHLAGGRAALNLARGDLGRDVLVFFYGTRETRVVVDITPVMHDKVQAVLCHRSQLRAPAVLYGLAVRVYGRLRGRPAQMPYAEGFRALELPQLTQRAMRARWPEARQAAQVQELELGSHGKTARPAPAPPTCRNQD
ncbi:MAG: PIG-L deacetylase family protein [Bacillota bacterium]|nr:PIG-L deacetylase family protein [Bacillota bacterium]